MTQGFLVFTIHGHPPTYLPSTPTNNLTFLLTELQPRSTNHPSRSLAHLFPSTILSPSTTLHPPFSQSPSSHLSLASLPRATFSVAGIRHCISSLYKPLNTPGLIPLIFRVMVSKKEWYLSKSHWTVLVGALHVVGVRSLELYGVAIIKFRDRRTRIFLAETRADQVLLTTAKT